MHCFLRVEHTCRADLTIHRMHIKKNESWMWTMERMLNSQNCSLMRQGKLTEAKNPLAFAHACLHPMRKWARWARRLLEFWLEGALGLALIMTSGPLGRSTSQILPQWRASGKVIASSTNTEAASNPGGWTGWQLVPFTCIWEPKSEWGLQGFHSAVSCGNQMVDAERGKLGTRYLNTDHLSHLN